MDKWLEARKSVLDTAREMCAKGLVIGNSGNVSLRLPGNLMAITPTSRHYDTLDYGDIPIVDFESRNAEGSLKPSVETPLHLAVYKARPNVNAVIHTHSVFASAVSAAGLEIPPILLDQVLFLGGEIKASSGPLVTTPEQIESFIRALGDRNAALLPGHGVVAAGKTMRDALINAELIEKTAHIFLLARGAGKVNLLPDDVIALEKAAYDRAQNGF
jgi:L-fuculose-phosphate aldolase